MKLRLVVFASLLALTVARPDIGLSKNYQPPSTRYGVPIPPTIPSGSYLPAHQLQTPIRNQVRFSGGSSSPVLTSVGHSSELLTTVGGGVYNRGHQIAPVRESELNHQNVGLGSRLSNDEHPGNDFTSFINYRKYSEDQYTTNYNQQTPQVEKSFYFFAAPDEPEPVHHPRVHAPIIPPKKNVRILFIKAPTYANPAPINIPAQPQNEEKTVVYVLVKKPEEHAEINIPAPIPTQPTKPEVYFIKYKNQKEAEEAIANVNQGHGHSGSISATDLNSNVDFIQTIKSGPEVHTNTRIDTRYENPSEGQVNYEEHARGGLPVSPYSTSFTIVKQESDNEVYGPPADSGPY